MRFSIPHCGLLLLLLLLPVFAVRPLAVLAADEPAMITSEFIFESAPFPSCHASTIVETEAGNLLAAWFGGTAEGQPDVGIWLSRRENAKWSEPDEVASHQLGNGMREPCWNPVLFRPRTGALWLFYKVGSSPASWHGLIKTSYNGAWSKPGSLPAGCLGPIKNKPVQLADGSILSPSSAEGLSPSPAWRIHFERSVDDGKTWQKIEVPVTKDSPDAIQPSILVHGDNRLQAIGRTRAGKLFTTWSSDGGLTWSELGLLSLPNPNAGTDAVTLKDGRHLLVYNHTDKGRTPLNMAVSRDGLDWQAALVLEAAPGEYSYPAVIQTGDGLVHVTYTWKRQRIKHLVLDPDKLQPRAMVGGQWPK